MRREVRERYPRYQIHIKLQISDPAMHVHARAMMQIGIANIRWRGKRSRNSRRMYKPQFYVSDKQPIALENSTPTEGFVHLSRAVGTNWHGGKICFTRQYYRITVELLAWSARHNREGQ